MSKGCVRAMVAVAIRVPLTDMGSAWTGLVPVSFLFLSQTSLVGAIQGSCRLANEENSVCALIVFKKPQPNGDTAGKALCSIVGVSLEMTRAV